MKVDLALFSMAWDRPLVTLLKSNRNGNLYCGIMRYLGTPAGGYGETSADAVIRSW